MNFILNILGLLLEALIIIILVRSVLSWLTPGQNNPISRSVYQITEPILAPLRRILPTWKGLDFSPFVAVVILWMIILVLGLI